MWYLLLYHECYRATTPQPIERSLEIMRSIEDSWVIRGLANQVCMHCGSWSRFGVCCLVVIYPVKAGSASNPSAFILMRGLSYLQITPDSRLSEASVHRVGYRALWKAPRANETGYCPAGTMGMAHFFRRRDLRPREMKR